MTNGITSIQINDQEVRLLFGMNAIRQIGIKSAEFPLFDGTNYTETGIAHILYAGYCNHCTATMGHPVIPFLDFYLTVENASLSGDMSDIKQAIKCFEDSRVVEKLTKQEGEKETKKKNGHGTKSKVSATESLISAPTNSAA